MLTRRRLAGFNLIEMTVALAVLGILISSSLPSVASWIRATRMRAVAESVQVGLQRARIEAMQRNQVVTFWLVTSPASDAPPDDKCALSPASASWVVSIDSPALQCNEAPSATTVPRIVETHGAGAAASSLVIAGGAAGGGAASSVSFNGYGQAVPSASRLSRLDITHPEAGQRAYRVEISPGGGIRMCDTGVAQASGDPRACEQP